jgi:hypothetical protein
MAVVITRDVTFGDGGRAQPRVVVGTVSLDGSNPTPIALAGHMSAVDAAVVSMEGAGTPGLDPTLLSSALSGTTVNVYAWKPGGAGALTLEASEDATRLVNFIAIGPHV